MSQVTEQSVRFQTALASIKLIQASAVLDLTEDDFDFLTSNKVWIATDRSRARRCVEACVYGTLDFVGYPRFPAPVRSEERFSRNAETDLVCRLLLAERNGAESLGRRPRVRDGLLHFNARRATPVAPHVLVLRTPRGLRPFVARLWHRWGPTLDVQPSAALCEEDYHPLPRNR